MDILFLAHRIPYPPDRGDKIRSWNMLRHLATLGRVHLACFADNAEDARHLHALRVALGGRLGEAHVEERRTDRLVAGAQALAAGKPLSLALFDSARMRRFVTSLLAREPISTIFAFSVQMAQFVPDDARQRFVMDFVDMDSAKYADYAARGSGPKTWVYAREAKKLLAFERVTAARADASLFVSEAEAGLFRRAVQLPGADIRAIHNGVDLDFYAPVADFSPIECGEGPLIVFTGQMDYRPNVEAVAAFAEGAFPAILKAWPTARFAIVGRNPVEPVVRLGAKDGIVVTGAVDDVRGWLAAADVVVAPLGIARGIQNKVLEAMAMARPVVASSAAFEGIEAMPSRDLLIADSPAEAVLALLGDRPRAEAMGAAARLQMERAYRWNARLAPLEALLRGPQRLAAE